MHDVRIVDGTKLYECKDVSKVDEILDAMEIPADRKSRINFLHQFMGVQNCFFCGTEEEEFALLKEELVVNHNSGN